MGGKNGMVYFILGALVVAVAVLGYFLYQEQQEPSIEINVPDLGKSN